MAKMRLTYYITASVVAAGGVVIDAFNRRPNFYSATVYLSQTPLCFMVLANFAFVCYASIIYALQRLLFGDLRIIERERLWERGWISITETLLIMMTFRDDVGAWFLFILANLVVARMWAWLAEGRTEMLEQQPPANPRLFHTRQSASLLICCVANFGFLKYCVDTVLEQARPGMMVMFAFEFAVLTITSFSNLFRYCIALYEIRETRRQTKARLEARRAELRAERVAAEALVAENSEGSAEAGATAARLAREETNLDENDVDVPGWEEKGRWVFGLDIITDFLRLVVYLAFFSVLMIFHGIPIHIVRDVYITLRSFLQRIYSFWQYRTATKDMNTRFPDATVEELERESTCIVCREDMRPWPAEGQPPMEQRLRAKKLPCGHILHFGCLRSWLERQQVCPTCRRPVLDAPDNGAATAAARARAQQPALPATPGVQADRPAAGQPQGGNHQGPGNAPEPGQGQRPNPFAQWRPRTLNLGPLRIAYGNMPAEALNALQQGQLNIGDGTIGVPPTSTSTATNAQQLAPPGSSAALDLELLQIERELGRQIMELNVHQQQLGLVRMLQSELARLRAMHANAQVVYQEPARHPAVATAPSLGAEAGHPAPAPAADAAAQTQLPAGITLPEGWTLLPLTRTEISTQQSWPAVSADRAIPPAAPANAGPSASVQLRTLQPTPTVPPSVLSDTTPATIPLQPTGVEQQSSAPAVEAPSNATEELSIQPSATQHPNGAAPPTWQPPATNGSSAVSAPPPTWSFDNTPAEITAHTGNDAGPKGGNLNGYGEQQQDSEQNDGAGEERTNKGKGRAVTVEDEAELD